MSWLKVLLVIAVTMWLVNSVALADTVFVSTWVLDGPPGAIYRVDSTIGGLIPIAASSSTPGFDLGVCGPDGNLYFAEVGKHRIIRVTQDGRQITPVAKLPGRDEDWPSAPDGPSFDSQGNLYFTTVAAGGLWRLEGANLTKKAVQVTLGFGGPPRGFIGAGTAVLTQGPYAGDVIVSHHASNVVYKINPSCSSSNTHCGQPTIFLEKNLSQTFGLAINSRGEIFVGSSDTTTKTVGRGWITKFASDGTFMGKFINLGNSEGDGMAFDSQDNLWTVNATALFKITPSGEKTLVTAIPFEGAGIAICKDSTAVLAHTTRFQSHFPLELTALWVFLGVYVFKRKVARVG